MSATPADHGAYSLRGDASGVVHLDWAEGLHVDEAVARAAIRSVNALNGPEQRPLLVRIVGAAGVSRRARVAFAEPSSASRVALLGNSPVEQMMANFVLKVLAPPVPTRFFTSEADAMQWLLARAQAA